jgi:hypothetical protein
MREVALAITKLTFESPIILKGFSAYIFCSDDLVQLRNWKRKGANAFAHTTQSFVNKKGIWNKVKIVYLDPFTL